MDQTQGAELPCLIGFCNLTDVMFFSSVFNCCPSELNLFEATGRRPHYQGYLPFRPARWFLGCSDAVVVVSAFARVWQVITQNFSILFYLL
jgi:hypothetical protein